MVKKSNKNNNKKTEDRKEIIMGSLREKNKFISKSSQKDITECYRIGTTIKQRAFLYY